MSHSNVQKLTMAGILVSLGIVFGDIGTSPLYVMKSIAGGNPISSMLVMGAISCVFWTLTLQTTLKYVLVTLRADNKGEGGIFALYSLVRRSGKGLVWIAMIGGAMLLADGIITPPISISSAVEGVSERFPQMNTMVVTIIILVVLFLFQPFGTSVVGKAFGPIMLLWFSMIAILGTFQIFHNPEILYALNPVHGFRLITQTENGFLLLGAVFLCTTGAEALYSDLGHCGRVNIRVSWIFVKFALVLNYLGQGAWMLSREGKTLFLDGAVLSEEAAKHAQKLNPFYEIMPDWFRLIGVGVATIAAVIASQALITGSFTLVSEAIRLGLFPRMKVNYPTDAKGQLYIPAVNFGLLLGCASVVLYFQKSENMEAAYGLAITVTMLMTTPLVTIFLMIKRTPLWLAISFCLLFFAIEGGFFLANIVKFWDGAYITLLIAAITFVLMFIWKQAHVIKGRLTEFVKIREYLDQLVSLSHDQTLPKYATHLVFLSTSPKNDEVEQKILYSILQKQPKRADIYWFVHIDLTDDPYTQEYEVSKIAENDVYRVTFFLGFRVQQRVNVFLRKVVEEMVENGEIDVVSRYHSLRERNITGDFKFIILEESFSYENQLPFLEELILTAQIAVKSVSGSPERWFGLDTSLVSVEKVPLVIYPARGISLSRRKKMHGTL